MSIHIGSKQLNKLYYGDKEIIKAYIGDQEVYSSAPSSVEVVDLICDAMDDDDDTSVEISMPDCVENDILLVFVNKRNTDTFNTPSGWTLLEQTTKTELCFAVFYKVAEGDESSVTITYTNSERVSWVTMAVRNCDTPVSDIVTGRSQYPNSPSLDSGAEEATPTIWFTVAGWTRYYDVSQWPTNCEDNRHSFIGNYQGSCCIGCASVSNSLGTFDPDPYSVKTYGYWIACTVALKSK